MYKVTDKNDDKQKVLMRENKDNDTSRVYEEETSQVIPRSKINIQISNESMLNSRKLEN